MDEPRLPVSSFDTAIHIAVDAHRVGHCGLLAAAPGRRPLDCLVRTLEEDMQLVLIRGLPGSGKSTVAKALHEAGFEWFEADSYHLNDEGDYCYDPANVKAAHEWCQSETFKALANGKRVVVSNTFTRRFEMEPYFEMAKTLGIEPNVLEATGNWPNVHGVPADVVEKMRQRWETVGEEF